MRKKQFRWPQETEENTLPVSVSTDKPKTVNVKPAEAAKPEETTVVKKPPTSEKAKPKVNKKAPAEEKEEIKFDRKRFMWPVQGSVKTRFGIQPNKTYYNWIKIASVTGMKVKAAASGIIIFSANLKDYGETIIIRHADNYATVYTHLKKRYVKTDQNVKKGENDCLPW